MKYDFTSIMDRHNMDAMAVDGLGKGWAPGGPKEGFDAIPMWVADMNFPTAPSIPEAIIKRAQHPAYGYFDPRTEYFDAIIGWQKTRHGVENLTPDDISYENGVLGGVITALSTMATPGDAVLVHYPTYIGFTRALIEAGYQIVHSPLKLDENGIWRMDFEDMERKMNRYKIHAAIFCSPFNPCGRVWERWELEQVMDLYRRHDCMVVSDEIWADLTLEHYKHIPTQSVSEDARNRTVALYAPSKTFNLAGLVGSYSIIYNKALRERHRANAAKSKYNHMNVLSMHALMGAYCKEGAEWVDDLRQVLSENVDYAYHFILDNFPGVTLAKPQGTYMLFLDCEGWCKAHNQSLRELQQAGWDVGVTWQDGTAFGGDWTIRMNLALPKSRVKEAFRRLKEYVFK